MHVLILLALGTVIQGPGTVWSDAFEARDTGIAVASSGDYHIWVWVKGDAEGVVKLGDSQLKLAKTSSSDYVWQNLGLAPLPQGTVKAEFPDNVAVIVATTDAAYDPKAILPYLRVKDTPETVGDSRAAIERFTNTVFTMTPFEGKQQWEGYAKGLRRRFKVSSGLWPFPERTPLNAKVSEVARHDDYIVEKVALEAWPGFLVTGNVYRPVGDGPYPAIACPHGHWDKGRFENDEKCSVAARCITFARMGMVAFSYDMVGYNDSRQFSKDWGHKPPSVPIEQRRQEALWGIHPFALQLWSSVRVLDYLEALPYVDPMRLACTGASGGGTQTFALSAIDPRVKVSAPVNMISHTMQGGCMCENAPIIRFDASNMEVGALAAPRPMLMVSASGDWTKTTQTVEFPAIRGVYEFYDAADRVENAPFDFGHNYNKSSREAVYRFFGKWLLNETEKYASFTEPAYEMEPIEALQNFPGKDAPAGYPDAQTVVKTIIAADRAKWEATLPKNANQFEGFRSLAAPALDDIVGGQVMTDNRGGINKLNVEKLGVVEGDTYTLERLIVRNDLMGSVLPALLYRPKVDKLTGGVLAVHSDGKAAFANTGQGGPGDLIKGLLAKGRAVLTLDVFLTGEHNSPTQRTVRVEKSFPDTFLPTDTAYRIQDATVGIAYLRSLPECAANVSVIGLGDAGVWCLFATALAQSRDEGSVRALVADVNGFNPEDDTAWVKGPYMPCIRAVGDVTTAATLAVPAQLTLWNAAATDSWSKALASYSAATGKEAASLLNAGSPAVDAVVAALQ
ncbi:MAG: hypothetical protein K1Y02_07505 [Candidatus Hydrogenedentes bacterium]|nr:hypothetical protein [Candidatus Hydrogenedentota bacterium]